MRTEYSNNQNLYDKQGRNKQTLITNEVWYRIVEHYISIPADALTNDDMAVIMYMQHKLQQQIAHDQYTAKHAKFSARSIMNGRPEALHTQLSKQIDARRRYVQSLNSQVVDSRNAANQIHQDTGDDNGTDGRTAPLRGCNGDKSLAVLGTGEKGHSRAGNTGPI